MQIHQEDRFSDASLRHVLDRVGVCFGDLLLLLLLLLFRFVSELQDLRRVLIPPAPADLFQARADLQVAGCNGPEGQCRFRGGCRGLEDLQAAVRVAFDRAVGVVRGAFDGGPRPRRRAVGVERVAREEDRPVQAVHEVRGPVAREVCP